MSDNTLVPKTLEIDEREIDNFRQFYGGTRPYAERMSTLLWVDMLALNVTYGVSPFQILRAIDQIEGLLPDTETKPAAQFRYPPLRGLWHKHYFSAHFIARNVVNQLGKRGMRAIVEDVMNPRNGAKTAEEISAEIAHRVVQDSLDARASNANLTGEWIVYAKHEGLNYYLACKPHSIGDQNLFNDIINNCPRDFPEIMQWIKEAAEALND